MKQIILIATLAFGMVPVAAHATEKPSLEPVDSLMLFSTKKNHGAVWTSAGSYYFQSFDAVVLNAGKKEVDLSKICYQAYDPKGTVYQLDTADESLAEGILKSSSSVHGFYQFTARDEGVYKASIVKAVNCSK